ncbi:hypothetical protein NL676_034117 [Syzygium grande]|nr:hypothetical protein NL676_034117 [Syzygium grande]
METSLSSDWMAGNSKIVPRLTQSISVSVGTDIGVGVGVSANEVINGRLKGVIGIGLVGTSSKAMIDLEVNKSTTAVPLQYASTEMM